MKRLVGWRGTNHTRISRRARGGGEGGRGEQIICKDFVSGRGLEGANASRKTSCRGVGGRGWGWKWEQIILKDFVSGEGDWREAKGLCVGGGGGGGAGVEAKHIQGLCVGGGGRGGLDGSKSYTKTLCRLRGGLEGSKAYTRTLCPRGGGGGTKHIQGL